MLEKASVVVLLLLHTICEVGVTVMIGVGFTVMVNVCTEPGQPATVGVTVKIPLTGAVPVLVTVDDGIVPPEPEESMPIELLLLFHV